jgi:hypothetical protein
MAATPRADRYERSRCQTAAFCSGGAPIADDSKAVRQPLQRGAEAGRTGTPIRIAPLGPQQHADFDAWYSRSHARLKFRVLLAPLLLGLVSAQSIRVGGDVYVGEILAVLLILPIRGRLRLPQAEKRIVLFGLLWSAAQLLSDVLNRTAPVDSAKGVLAPLLFIATIAGFGSYFRRQRARVPSFMLGVALGTLASQVLFPLDYFFGNPWKWGVGTAVLAVYSLHYSFLARRKSLIWLFVALLAFFIVSLYEDSRSMAFLPLFAGLGYALFRAERGERFFKLFSGRWGLARLLPLIVVSALLVNGGATALFNSQSFLSRISPAAAQKYQTQAGGTFGVLLGGRSELFVSAQAFVDSPLLGHGSWAKDTNGYRQAYADRSSEFGYSQDSQLVMASPWIPTHSYLMGALVWSGFLGGVFWILVIVTVLNLFLSVKGQVHFYFYIGITVLIWDIMFSPFGAAARWSSAVFLASFFSYHHMSAQCKAYIARK